MAAVATDRQACIWSSGGHLLFFMDVSVSKLVRPPFIAVDFIQFWGIGDFELVMLDKCGADEDGTDTQLLRTITCAKSSALSNSIKVSFVGSECLPPGKCGESTFHRCRLFGVFYGRHPQKQQTVFINL